MSRLGAAATGLAAVFLLGPAVSAFADPTPPPPPPMGERHRALMESLDSDKDGFVTRAEAEAFAGKMFDEMDADHDGKLGPADHAAHRMVVIERRVDGREEPGGPGPKFRFHHQKGGGKDDGPPPPEDMTAPPEGMGPPGGHGPHMLPPMPMMILMHTAEADRDGDGALSRSEFIAQQLRFFDAADANGDGKIQFSPPPMLPEPPEPPAPPAPPK